MSSSGPRDRLARERERLVRAWASLSEEQEAMRSEGEKLNTFTKELEGLRAKLAGLEAELDLEATSTNRVVEARRRENEQEREKVLTASCHVENRIKDGLNLMEKALGREKKRFRRELERVQMEGLWNIVDGFRRRNAPLTAVQALWVEEEDKINRDLKKVEELRTMCWTRMKLDADKLDALRAAERLRQQRQQAEEYHRQREEERKRQEETFAKAKNEREEAEKAYARRQQQKRQQQQQQQQQQYQGNAGGYGTDSGAGAHKPWEYRSSRNRTAPPSSSIPYPSGRTMQETMLIAAWRGYQGRWVEMLASSATGAKDMLLTYDIIPWPVPSAPYLAPFLTPARISAFLLAPFIQETKTSLERIREAMKLWHPDKWEGHLMTRVAKSDQVAVREGVATVARGLIELLQIHKRLKR